MHTALGDQNWLFLEIAAGREDRRTDIGRGHIGEEKAHFETYPGQFEVSELPSILRT
jgi:hypothetical protein